MSKPLMGYEKEIAILHAEANQSAELIEEFKGVANGYKQAIERVRELHSESEFGTCKVCIAGYIKPYPYNYKYPCPTIQALDDKEQYEKEKD